MIRTYLSRAQINADRVAALLVTLAPLVYFFPALRGQIIISPDDGVIFNVPLRVAAANIIRAGHLPLWDPYIFSGMPLHASAQAGLLFPLNWFYLICLAAGRHKPDDARDLHGGRAGSLSVSLDEPELILRARSPPV